MMSLRCPIFLLRRLAAAARLPQSSRLLSYSTSSDGQAQSWRKADLTSRSVVRVQGKDSTAFLQGLVTNDVHLLDGGGGGAGGGDGGGDGGPRSIYTLMLNLQGRVMFDVVVQSDAVQKGSYFLDCDFLMKEKLIKHLKMFKLRKDVTVSVADRCRVAVLFPTQNGEEVDVKRTGLSEKTAAGSFPNDVFNQPINQSSEDNNVNVKGSDNRSDNRSDNEELIKVRDPRLSLLGFRTILRDGESVSDSFSKSDEAEYRRFRYQIGVAEGSFELPFGECLPFESNADYLAGVHFNKGCYLGQELTARTHHTGVVRKRLMPVVLDGLSDTDIVQQGTPITVGGSGKTVGKLRTHLGADGLALLRISEALAAENLVVSFGGKELSVRTRKPNWWPEPDANV